MKNIAYMECHSSCSCYEQGDKAQSPVIEKKTIKTLEMGEMTFPVNELLLILEGRLRFTRSNTADEDFRKGQMVCLPAGDRVRYRSLTKSRLLILRIEEGLDLCSSYSLDRLCAVKPEVERPESLVPLELNVPLRHFVQSLVHTLDDGLKCRVYFRNGINILLTMLQTYYTPHQLCRFFYPILHTDTLFSEQVRMQQEKARLIYTDISKSNKPFKDIAQSYGFTVQANFNRFCHTAFAMNPRDIRKRVLNTKHLTKEIQTQTE